MDFEELSYWLHEVNEYNRKASETAGGGS